MFEQQRRSYELLAILVVVFLFFAGTLLKIQIVKADDYKKSTVSSYSVNVEAARGEILDRNGTPLVTNRQGNSIVFNYAFFPTDQKMRNEIIMSLINLCNEYGVEYIDNLPILMDDIEGNSYSFEPEREEDIKWLKSSEMLSLNSYATADNCMKALIKRYALEDYAPADAIKIASVCAEMKHVNFSISTQYTFAEDVPMELVSIIMENGSFYKGVENLIVPYREYEQGDIAPHIMGRVAKISAEQYADEKEKTCWNRNIIN